MRPFASGLLLLPVLWMFLRLCRAEVGTMVETAVMKSSEEEAVVDVNDEVQPRKKQERAVTRLVAEAKSESKKNVTLANETSNTGGFMPSFHLGPIDVFPATVIELPSVSGDNGAPAKSNRATSQNVYGASHSPFNSVRPIKFDNGITGQNNTSPPSTSSPQKQGTTYHPSEKIENFVKFMEQTMQQYRKNFGDATQRYNSPIIETPSPQLDYHEFYPHHHQQQQPQPTYGLPDEGHVNGQQQQPPPPQQHFVAHWTTPATTSGYPVHHPSAIVSNESPFLASHPDNHFEHLPPGQIDSHYPHFSPEHTDGPSSQYHFDHHHSPPAPPEILTSDVKPSVPETVINVHPISFQATSLDGIPNPKTVIYVTTHDHHTLKMQKSPPWQSGGPTDGPGVPDNGDSGFFNYHPLQHPSETDKRISPWRRILHIIGTFLPLGLLIALLSPRVITTDYNGSEPNIILSKLRVNDLPAEHKNSRLSALDTAAAAIGSRNEVCEERSICRLLAATNMRGSHFMKRLLINITERTPESAVRKKELDRIFEAAKLGKCDILTCGLYDGT